MDNTHADATADADDGDRACVIVCDHAYALTYRQETHMAATRRTATDKLVCDHVRRERVSSGMTQPALAKAIGVTYQQMHKYETGLNRISAGRLADIAKALKLPITHFFEQPPESEDALSRRSASRRLVSLFAELPRSQQDGVLAMVNSMVKHARGDAA